MGLQAQSDLTADSFSKFFSDKVNDVRASTAGSADPEFTAFHGHPLDEFIPLSVSNVVRLVKDSRAVWTRSQHGSWKILCKSLHHTSRTSSTGHCHKATFLRYVPPGWGYADPQEVHPRSICTQQLHSFKGAGESCQWADVITLTIERTPAGKSICVLMQPLNVYHSSEGDLRCTDCCWSG